MGAPELYRVSAGIYALDVRPMGIKGFLSPYVLLGREVAVIDPGPACSIQELIRGLEALGVRPESVRYVLATHIHIDHAGGAALLLDWAREAELLVHGRGVRHMA
ncbi:MBL fold metallo-hydrolase, partial [Candidatus Bathyarchaeota archaeon]